VYWFKLSQLFANPPLVEWNVLVGWLFNQHCFDNYSEEILMINKTTPVNPPYPAPRPDPCWYNNEVMLLILTPNGPFH
jgi:hypothetical protein